MRHRTWTSAASAVLVLTAVVGLAGCGDDSDSASTSGAGHGGKDTSAAGASAPVDDHNDADVAFASHLILHHQQAVQLSGIAGWQATSGEVKTLAQAIKTVQEPQMKVMAAWLTGWGKPVPAPSHGGHAMDDSIPGMLTEDELHELGRTAGTMFDRVWIQTMIRHHQGAVTMAKAEQTNGKNPAAIALAHKVVTTQSAQIATLKRLQGRLPVR